MSISLVVIVENLFKVLLLFLFNLIWCTYFIKSGIWSVFIAITISVIVTLLINKLTSRKNIKAKPKLKEQEHIKNIKNEFIYMSQEDLLNFFYKLASTKHNAIKTQSLVSVKNGNKDIIIYPLFKTSEFNMDDLAFAYKAVKDLEPKKLIILTNKYDKKIIVEVEKFKFEVKILNMEETYLELLKPYEFYPEITVKPKKKSKTTLKYLMAVTLNKKKTKAYLLSALVLFFSSFFVIYKIYYVVISSILVLLAIFSEFNPKFNTIKSENLLD